MRIAIVAGALVVAVALVGLLVLSRESPHAAAPPTRRDASVVRDAHATTPAVVPVLQDAPIVRPPDDSPQLRAVRSSGIAQEPWAADAAALAARLAPGSTTTCYVAGCIVEHAAPAQFAADTTWTGGKQWIGATLILYRPD
jgi:hypothetical protein